MESMSPEGFALSIVVLLFSVIVHEVMHGLVALRFGDDTAQRQGRLTLNPIPHIDPIGTVLLPALLIISGSPILFGWAKPVPVNPLKFKDIKRGEIFVSAAGILSNLGLALVATVLFHILNAVYPTMLGLEILYFAVTINLLLAIFNLIPIPPLDGSKIAVALLPYDAARNYQQIEKYGFLILLALLIIPFGGGSLLGAFLGTTVDISRGFLGFN